MYKVCLIIYDNFNTIKTKPMRYMKKFKKILCIFKKSTKSREKVTTVDSNDNAYKCIMLLKNIFLL